ncbi:MAG: winged helix-turn-helix transcriptional regulator [Geodermatophilaceae bacterium]|nr:winged helix-turn-helix transcriptional regulator [Geodermatophilaceae bacterium]
MSEAVWAALVDPHRRAVLDVLRHRASSVGELVDQVGLSQPATSKHLRVLRDAGLVSVCKRAQQRIYAVEPGPIADLEAWLAPYRRLWNDRLDALGRQLDDPGGRPTSDDAN